MSQLQEQQTRRGVGLSAVPPPHDRGRDSQVVRVLDADEQLGRGLEGDRLARARVRLTGRPVALDTGRWDVTSLHGTASLSAGLLLVEGFIARELLMADRASVELLGPGDLLRPWDETESLLPFVVKWNVLSAARAIVLGPAFAAEVREFPEVSLALLSRVHGRAQRLAESQAIAHTSAIRDRLHAMLWHFADRWGRVTTDGVVVPLALSHRMLAEFIGARRPTVSAALAELARENVVIRRQDGTWLLAQSASPRHTAPPARRIPMRRRFIQPEQSRSVTFYRNGSDG
ncbi:MAG TPA: Crp/Fnr family transcriptional regulator [Microbacterium sp.]|nr:Crp/Fnr family transcriptional regulator [Microbacterium sp.]